MEALINYSLFTNEISLINHHMDGEAYHIDPQIHRTIDKKENNIATVTYCLEIKNTDEHPFPIDLTVSLTGVFDISKLNGKDVDDFLRIQSCQIIFPHIRTIVSTITSTALMQPILLPIIDAKKVFEEESN